MPYPPPLDQLLSFGDAWAMDPWPDYPARFGLGPQHVPDLVRMATDRDLLDGEGQAAWAPAHAWRALGQLGAAEAAEPLTRLLYRIDVFQDDGIDRELPLVFGLLGAGAVPALSAYLAEAKNKFYARVAAAHGLKEIAARQPEARSAARSAAVGALAAQLEHFARQDETLNAFLIAYLLDLKAAEQAGLIERAYAAGRVATEVPGDWEDAQIALGLLAERTTPRPDYQAETREALGPLSAGAPPREVPEHIRAWNERLEAQAAARAAARASRPEKKRRRRGGR